MSSLSLLRSTVFSFKPSLSGAYGPVLHFYDLCQELSELRILAIPKPASIAIPVKSPNGKCTVGVSEVERGARSLDQYWTCISGSTEDAAGSISCTLPWVPTTGSRPARRLLGY